MAAFAERIRPWPESFFGHTKRIGAAASILMPRVQRGVPAQGDASLRRSAGRGVKKSFMGYLRLAARWAFPGPGGRFKNPHSRT